MSDMSPLQRLLLKAMRYASLGAAILLLGFLILALWQKAGADFTSAGLRFHGDSGLDASGRGLAVPRHWPGNG